MKLCNRCILAFTVLSLHTLHPANASGDSYGSVLVDEVTSIYDGDTFRATIKDWPTIIGQRIPVRINGIDTPELRGKCQAEKDLARSAKEFTVLQLRSAKVIELRNVKRGKYFRILADVSVDGRDLGDALFQKGLAVKYNGSFKVIWCKKED